MNFKKQIEKFTPNNEQEIQDKKIILQYIEKFPYNILVRENEFAHITSSGFILNENLDKMLMIHHNIRKTWSWTGGHVDGDKDFLHVAIKEAKEETGINNVRPLGSEIVSLDVLPVDGHIKNGKYVNTHVHLSVAYILIASEQERLKVKYDENSAVVWFEIDKLNEKYFSDRDIYLYNKLIDRAKDINKNNELNIGKTK